MAEEVYLTPEERLSELSDSIIAGVINTDEESLMNRRYLYGSLPVKVFSDENFVIYSVLYQFRDRGITPDQEFLKMYLMRNTKFFKENKDKFNMADYESDDSDTEDGYISAVIKQYVRLQGIGCTGDFKLAIEKYKVEYSAIEMNKAYSQSRLILYEGLQIGRRFYQGFEDSVTYTKKVAADIENMLDNSLGDGFIDSRKEGIIDKEESKPELIGDFDLIEELNEYLGGIYTGFLINVVAPTKGGKSKFTTRLAHTMIVKYGVNISVWAVEGGHEAWWAQLRAIHFEYMYIRNAVDGNKVAPLSQDDILRGNYPSDAIRSLEEASRLDLFTNDSYGIINMINRPFYEETFIDEIDTSVKVNNSRAVFIDYLQLITSDVKGRSVSETVKSAYKKALKFTKDYNVSIISPAQFTQEFIKQLSSSKGGTPETRTSGGESSEVIRSADINIALYASLDDLTRNSMTIMSMPSRLSKTFPAFEIYADLCPCLFSSIQ